MPITKPIPGVKRICPGGPAGRPSRARPAAPRLRRPSRLVHSPARRLRRTRWARRSDWSDWARWAPPSRSTSPRRASRSRSSTAPPRSPAPSPPAPARSPIASPPARASRRWPPPSTRRAPIILMVPAGAAVDEMIAALTPLLGPDGLIIDAGNADFHDTRRRAAEAAAAGRPYLGIGVSGGEEGARHGPSIMGGGPKPAWDRVAPILEAIAARFEAAPCAAWMGPDGAGHFVKTVHNGIEYADMQMIAEVYGILRDGLGLDPAGDRRRLRPLERGAAPVLPRRDHRHRLPRHRPRHRPAARRRHPRPRRAEGHRPLDRDRGPAPRRPGDGDRGGGGRAQHLGAARRAPGRRRAVRRHRRGRSTSTPPRSRRRCSPARSPATPRASASSPRPRRNSAGACRSTASPGSGGPDASSARRCSTTWRRRSRARPMPI